MKKNSRKYRKMKKLKEQSRIAQGEKKQQVPTSSKAGSKSKRKIEWVPIGWSMMPVDVTDMNEEEKAEAIKEANKLSRGIIG